MNPGGKKKLFKKQKNMKMGTLSCGEAVGRELDEKDTGQIFRGAQTQ